MTDAGRRVVVAAAAARAYGSWTLLDDVEEAR